MDGHEAPTPWSFAGTFCTIWALTLAFVIYVLTADDTAAVLAAAREARDEVASLKDQLSSLLSTDTASTEQEGAPLDGKHVSDLDRFERSRPYVEAVLAAEPSLTTSDIARAWKPAGQGNKPWVVESLSGARWSVYLGGRGKREYTVTPLDALVNG